MAEKPKAEKPKAEKPKGEKPKGEKPKGEKKAKPEKAKAETAKTEAGQAAESGPKVPPRLRQYYVQEVVPALRERFDYRNPMMIPRPIKVVLNVGVGRAHQNPKVLEGAVNDLGTVSGQKPVKTRARKSISNFKLREGMEIGAMVTLRNERMWEFLDRFINVALPRLRDFRGVPSRLSGSGDYTLGLRDQLVFPEIDYDKVDELRGMNVTVVTTARTDEEGRELLSLLGLPFRRA